MRHGFAALLVLPGVLACASPASPDAGLPASGPGLRLETSRTAYRVGDSVVVTVVNVAADTLYVSGCCDRLTVPVDRWDGSRWAQLTSDPCLQMCPSGPMALPPQDSLRGAVNSALEPGHYRVHVGAARRGAPEVDWSAMSNGFDVRN